MRVSQIVTQGTCHTALETQALTHTHTHTRLRESVTKCHVRRLLSCRCIQIRNRRLHANSRTRQLDQHESVTNCYARNLSCSSGNARTHTHTHTHTHTRTHKHLMETVSQLVILDERVVRLWSRTLAHLKMQTYLKECHKLSR